MSARAAGARLLLAVALVPMLDLSAQPSKRGDAALAPIAFADLAGWGDDDHAAAWPVFRRSCEAIANELVQLRPALPASANLRRVCRAAAALPSDLSAGAARAFFEAHFQPLHVTPPSGQGFLTGYFEPEYDGSLTADETFATPLLARPDDLVTLAAGETVAGVEPGLQAARRTDDGLEPYPERAAIEDGALGTRAKPLVFLRDGVEAFVIHVQGSARIRLRDGRLVRLAYAGRNGRPYTSIGRILVERGHLSLEEMSLERLMAWLRANPAEARDIMRQNRSYIFFRLADELEAGDGPIGGAGVPLTPGRSLAVDRGLWSYGLPFWLEGMLPRAGGGADRLQRLVVAEDTGSAIVGPARGDFFFGSGTEAGTRAGLLRHPARFVVLWPKPPVAP
jgi:membrane-bound lytic murein transglycosylase A